MWLYGAKRIFVVWESQWSPKPVHPVLLLISENKRLTISLVRGVWGQRSASNTCGEPGLCWWVLLPSVLGQDTGLGAAPQSPFCSSKNQGGCLCLVAFATKYLWHTLDFPYKNVSLVRMMWRILMEMRQPPLRTTVMLICYKRKHCYSTRC